jgi:hypothetical protein
MEDVPIETLIADVVTNPAAQRTDCWPRLPDVPPPKTSRAGSILHRIVSLLRRRRG